MSRTRRRVAATLAGVVFLTAGCELNETIAPDLEPRVVVHAVLNPGNAQQIVIVERTLRSIRITSQEPTRDPVPDARVVVYGPDEDDSTVAIPDPVNGGIYRIQSVTIRDGVPGSSPPNVLTLRPGRRYRLRVETSIGVVTGETIIPVVRHFDLARRTFNVDRDTLRLSQLADATAGYMLRHETNTGARDRFVTTLDDPLLLPLAQAGAAADDAEWAFDWARDGIRPGHAQNFAVVALDSNYIRYYVAGFDPFGDETRGNTLTGGVGLFGAVTTMMAKTLDLVADIDSPVEGNWTADRPSLTMPSTLTLYSSPYFPGRLPTGNGVYVSGRGRSGGGRLMEATGSVAGGSVALEMIDLSGAGADVFATGLLAGANLVLTDTRSGERINYSQR